MIYFHSSATTEVTIKKFTKGKNSTSSKTKIYIGEAI